MAKFSLTALLRRFYLAASDLHWSVLLAVLVLHMTASWWALRWAGEADLTRAVPFVYWYATTASTVGYGDLSPKGDAGRMVAAFFVMPGAIALFTATIARSFAGLAALWQRRRSGMGDYTDLADAVVLIGYDAQRTPRMIDEIVADARSEGRARQIVLVATSEIDGDDPRYRFVRASALTAPADLLRAGVAKAARVIVFASSDAETLAAALAVTALNNCGHIVCFFDSPDTARLLAVHCPRVEIVLTPSVELVVKALNDPGSSRLLMQLASHTDAGATLYATAARATASFGATADGMRARGGILIASCPAGEDAPRFDLGGEIAAGDRLFYVARARIPA